MPKVDSDDIPDEYVLSSASGRWFKLLAVSELQVRRGLNAKKQIDGERGLAVVAIAVVLEAWLGRVLAGPVVAKSPEWFREDVFPENVPTLYRSLPRLCGVPPHLCLAYEQSHLHERAKRIFALRNQVAHASKRWDHRALRGANLIDMWRAALDLIALLEETGSFDIPRSRIKDFRAEIEELKKLES